MNAAAAPPRRRRNPRGQGGQLATEILEAGRQIIEDTGDEARVTVSEIARRVRISAPSIYDHFTGLDQICQLVVASAWDEYSRAMTATIDPTGSLYDQVADFARAYVRFSREHWGLYRVLYARTSPSPMPDTAAAARIDFTRIVTGVALVLDLDATSADAWDAAVGLWIQLHGIASLPPVHPRFDWPTDQRLIEAALRRSGLLEPAEDEH